MADDEEDELDIQLGSDVYDAVVAAAFGGVVVSLPLAEIGKGENRKAPSVAIHPFLVWCLAALLFVVQMSCMTCLILDIDFEKPFNVGSWDAFNETPGRRILLCSKVIMTVVLQMIVLKEFLSALKPLAFLCNPFTWQEVWRPSTANPRLFHAGLCVPFCITAEIMQLIVAYMVATLSMSVIMRADRVSDVIFNGLVITFLTDLDEYAWEASAAIFHVDARKYGLFKFRLLADVIAEDEETTSPSGKKRKDLQAQEMHLRRKAAIREAEQGILQGGWKIWFYRGRGGKVQILENLFIFGGLCLMFFRQCIMFVQAFDTGILPLTRDICHLYRGLHGHDRSGALTLKFFDVVTLVDYRHSLENCITRYNVTDCFDDHMRALDLFRDAPTYFFHPIYKRYLVISFVMLVAVFILPQVLFANHIHLISLYKRYGGTAEPEKENYAPLAEGEGSHSLSLTEK
jgi:hypothetical protein